MFGKLSYPLNPGLALLSSINSSAILSRYKEVIPGLISSANKPKVFETNWALSLIFFEFHLYLLVSFYKIYMFIVFII